MIAAKPSAEMEIKGGRSQEHSDTMCLDCPGYGRFRETGEKGLRSTVSASHGLSSSSVSQPGLTPEGGQRGNVCPWVPG